MDEKQLILNENPVLTDNIRSQVRKNLQIDNYCKTVELFEDNLTQHFNSTLIGNGTTPAINFFDISSTFCTAAASSVMALYFVLFVIAFLLLSWYPLKIWWEKRNQRLAEDPSSPLSHLPLPPGDFGPPIIGETFLWLTQGSKFNSSRRKKYGNVFKTNTIGSPMIRVTGQEYVREILTGEHDKVTTIWPINVRKILGENVLVNSLGAIHRQKRKVACKAFTMSSLNNYLPRLVKHARRNVKAMDNSERPLVYNCMLRLTFDLAASTLLGLDPAKPECQKLVNSFYNLVSNIFCIPLMIPGLGFSKAMKARAEILLLLQDHIREKKNEIMNKMDTDSDEKEVNNLSAFDFIIREMLIENSKINAQKDETSHDVIEDVSNESNAEPIDDLALKEMAMELMFAGYFTSGSALTSCILELAQHPDVFKKVEDELLANGFLKDSTTKTEPEPEITLKEIHNLKYMEQVLKETLRVKPPVLGGYRRARKTFQLGKYRVPKGWAVIYNIRDTHEFEYEDMDTFDPDRFAPDKATDDKFRFIPFGGGPRTCIGREYARLIVKLALIEMFRHYRKWALANKKLPKMKAIPTLHPSDGLPCILYSRQEIGVVQR